jgi:uncharacterized membrane protein YhaH (DUF805 family)
MNMVEAVASGFKNTFDFKGRASRPEYWWCYLAYAVLSLIFYLLSVLSDNLEVTLKIFIISSFVNLLLIVPFISLSWRRLHDTGRSGWWNFLALTIIGVFPLRSVDNSGFRHG